MKEAGLLVGSLYLSLNVLVIVTGLYLGTLDQLVKYPAILIWLFCLSIPVLCFWLAKKYEST